MLKTKTIRYKLSILSLFVLMSGMLLPALTLSQVDAAQIENRSLTLIGVGTDGGSKAGGTVNHLFEFDLATAANVGSIKFEYCTTAAAVPNGIDCNVPTGLDASSATVGAESGATGFSVDNVPATTNEVVINRAEAQATPAEPVSYRLDGIVNPTTENETFFVRITTHESTDANDAVIDSGTVTASTATQIELTGIMPESLVFCTGESIDTTNGVPDCTTATSGNIDFDQLFSSTDTATALSQMSASTNAGQGYAITVNGPTLTSGSNEIAPMDDGGAATGLVLGTNQFGMNLVENVTTTDTNNDPLGLNPAPTANNDNYYGLAATNYDTADAFKFGSGDVVANSDSEPSDAQIFTSSYVVNVAGSLPAGTYNTTLTYIATATF